MKQGNAVTVRSGGVSITMTTRQSLALYLFAQCHWSKRRIGRELGVVHDTVRRDLNAVKQMLIDACAEESSILQPLIEGCFSVWCASEQLQRPRIGAPGEDSLAQDLETKMASRAAELKAFGECMGANESPSHERSKGGSFTHWELVYLMRHPELIAIPSHAYDCKVCGRYARD